jgi:hypothetical protein
MMNTLTTFRPSVMKDNIPAYEILYQQALKNDEQFHVLKDIRESINRLKKSVENKAPLSVERILLTFEG